MAEISIVSGFAVLKSGSLSLEKLRPEVDSGLKPFFCALLYAFPHDAGFYILILEIKVFNKRSAHQMER